MTTLKITITLDGEIMAEGSKEVGPKDSLDIEVLSSGRKVLSLALQGLRTGGTRVEAYSNGVAMHHYQPDFTPTKWEEIR